MNKLTELLRPHVEDIKEAAARGDTRAQRVINLYQLHLDCPSDPGAPVFCKAVFEEWLKSHR